MKEQKNQFNEVSVVSNDLVNIVMSNMTSSDLNIFDYCCYLCKGKGTEVLTIPYKELKSIAFNGKNISNKEFYEIIEKLSDKMMCAYVHKKTEGHSAKFTLFQYFENIEGQSAIKIQVSERYAYMLNNLKYDFTMFEIKEYLKLKKNSSKYLLKHLAQFRSTGYWKCSIEDIRLFFDIPNLEDKYLMSRYLKPATDEVSHLFNHISVNALKDGRKLIAFEWHFEFKNDLKIIPMPKTKQVQTSKPRQPKNKFHNFEQREYSDEFYADLERKLRAKN